MINISTVAAEPSGDVLGSRLMQQMKQQVTAQWTGIGGAEMIQQGLHSDVAMDKLTVMGLVEVLKHLPELLGIRKELSRRLLQQKPDLFIGIDAPDFNLKLEQTLRSNGIKTVHYVCPTVWAWRTGRVKQLKKSADLVLCIFPFEVDFLHQHGVKGEFIGHPLADEFPLQVDVSAARQELGLLLDKPVLALLPGSRHTEISQLSQAFLEAALLLKKQHPSLQIIAPFANHKTRDEFLLYQQKFAPDLQVLVFPNQSRAVLAAADVVLTASGTATFEALLSKKPMVVAYKVHPITYWIAKTFKLVKIPYFAMANLLADKPLAAEFIQHDCVGDKLAKAVDDLLNDEQKQQEISSHYLEIHQRMRLGASEKAAQAIARLLEQEHE